MSIKWVGYTHFETAKPDVKKANRRRAVVSVKIDLIRNETDSLNEVVKCVIECIKFELGREDKCISVRLAIIDLHEFICS